MKILLYLIVVFSLLKISKSQLTSAEQQEFLQLHNYYRSTVVPSAANMLMMQWNDIVAMMSQDYANNFTNWSQGHSSSTYRTYNDGVDNGYHGENLAIGFYNPSDVMTAWVVDERTAIPRDDSSRSNGGHMSQVVWATSWQLGCGAKDNVLFTINGFNYTGRFYICQYGPGGNIGTELSYISGTSCSQCPSGFIYCNNNLCSQQPASLSIRQIPSFFLLVFIFFLLF